MIKEKLKKKIRTILERQPSTRDNDNLLIAIIWASETKATFTDEFLTKLAYGELTSSESIRRARQKLQEENEHLRGELYNERQRKGKEVSQTINN